MIKENNCQLKHVQRKVSYFGCQTYNSNLSFFTIKQSYPLKNLCLCFSLQQPTTNQISSNNMRGTIHSCHYLLHRYLEKVNRFKNIFSYETIFYDNHAIHIPYFNSLFFSKCQHKEKKSEEDVGGRPNISRSSLYSYKGIIIHLIRI